MARPTQTEEEGRKGGERVLLSSVEARGANRGVFEAGRFGVSLCLCTCSMNFKIGGIGEDIESELERVHGVIRVGFQKDQSKGGGFIDCQHVAVTTVTVTGLPHNQPTKIQVDKIQTCTTLLLIISIIDS
jgi:hypothetical protein